MRFGKGAYHLLAATIGAGIGWTHNGIATRGMRQLLEEIV
jgi:hypothetical protein